MQAVNMPNLPAFAFFVEISGRISWKLEVFLATDTKCLEFMDFLGNVLRKATNVPFIFTVERLHDFQLARGKMQLLMVQGSE